MSTQVKSTQAKKASAAARRAATVAGGTWQAEKSQITRNQILEATLLCLVEIGYAQTTTEKIAKRANLSRGAMTHHFKSRADVFAAAAQYITERRAQEYDDAVKNVNLPLGNLPTLESMRETMVVLQKYYASPSFVALQELLRGARTDKDLKKIMVPLEKSLDQKISEILLARFPVWADIPETSEMLRDLILSSLQGIAVDPSSYLKGERLQRFLELLANVAMAEFEKAYKAVHGPRALKKAASTAATAAA